MGELFDGNIVYEFVEIMSKISYNYCNSRNLEQKYIKMEYLGEILKQSGTKQINVKDVKNDKLINEMKRKYKNVLKELKEKSVKREVRLRKSIEEDIQIKFTIENTMYKEDGMIFMNDLRKKYLKKGIKNIDFEIIKYIDARYIIESIKICKKCLKKHRSKCCENYNNKDRTMRTVIRNMEMRRGEFCSKIL